MTLKYILPLNHHQATLETVGGKGASLARLASAGFRVPDGFHITTAAYRDFIGQNDLDPVIASALEGVDPAMPSTLEAASRSIQQAFMAAPIPPDIAGEIVAAYGDLAGSDPAVAVRSSATAEDLPEASFAGQQDTYLNISGADHVLEATKKCWSSLWTARAIGYRKRQGITDKGLSLAVIIQLLVNAEVAGILFTVNPMDAKGEHLLINAAWGLGDAVVGGRVTPDEYIVQKDNGKTVSKHIAVKDQMTVRTETGTDDQPVPANLRQVPALESSDLQKLSRLGVQIEELYGKPMDVEWALADGQFSIVQARPITTLKENAIEPADEWPLPSPKSRFMRASIVDMMPDPLSPLFATMGLAAYNDTLEPAIGDVMGGKRNFLPDNLIRTIRHYAYMRVNYSGKEIWFMLTVLAPRMPRLIRQGPDHFRNEALPEYARKVKQLEGKPPQDMPPEEIWQDAHELARAALYHLSVLQVDTLGAAAGSEGLFSVVYRRFFRREGDPDAPTFLMGYDTLPMQSEKSLFDLASWAEGQPGLAPWLLKTPAAEISQAHQAGRAPDGLGMEVWREWKQRFDDHLDRFGHLFYDLDFAKPVPADDPAPLLEALKMYLRGEGVDPHVRQQNLEAARLQATEELLARAHGLRGWILRKTLGWAQSLGQVREDSIASIGLAYPRLREILHELGRRLAQAGAFEDPEDIYWLEESEIEAMLPALHENKPLKSMTDRVQERKASIEQARKRMPPTTLPPSDTYMGLPIQAFVPGEGGQEGNRLKGVGASAGQVTGTACVLHGPEDFDQMQTGGILVAKMTTPAWTPLFAMAGAIVTDIGGPLSHGSIVAREYGIPAVLGTGAATRLIHSGQQITVDGTEGYVTLASEAPC